MVLYVLTLGLIHLPPVQKFIEKQAASSLSEVLGTDVSIERVELGFLNRIILDDVLVLDQQKKDLLRVGRLSAKIDLLPLAEGRISISSAQLFGAHAQFYLLHRRIAAMKKKHSFLYSRSNPAHCDNNFIKQG